MNTERKRPPIYDGEGDRLMEDPHGDRIILLPDARPSKVPDRTPRIRLMWGQHLPEDLLSGRYRSLVCAVNDADNKRGIITQLATLLPTSQWDERSITSHARTFSKAASSVRVLKYDMDSVQVLAVLRPAGQDHLTLDDLSAALPIVTQMLNGRPDRQPSASVSFLGASSNALRGPDGKEPSLETVLRIMYESGYRGDVYPAPSMWEAAPTALYARYPFPGSLETMREGGS